MGPGSSDTSVVSQSADTLHMSSARFRPTPPSTDVSAFQRASRQTGRCFGGDGAVWEPPLQQQQAKQRRRQRGIGSRHRSSSRPYSGGGGAFLQLSPTPSRSLSLRLQQARSQGFVQEGANLALARGTPTQNRKLLGFDQLFF